MKKSDLSKIDAIFSAAIDLNPEQQPQFLDQQCGDDVELRAQVEALLEADQGSQTTLKQFMGKVWDCYRSSAELQPGEQLGSFKIVEPLGSGGMGNVYLAKRITPDFEQTVAIKVLRIDSGNTEHLHQRFLQEQRLLANLNHPYIAQLMDGGRPLPENVIW